MAVKVSIVIPVYNVENYLRQCLDSVVNQTLREIEIICVDDGSTDGSPAILAEYAAKDPRIKVITRTKTNAGAARNAGMEVATGEYLGFVDSDDWCETTLFEKAFERAKSDDADLVFWAYSFYNNGTQSDAGGRAIPQSVLSMPRPFRPAGLGLNLFNVFNFAPWNRIVRKSLINRYEVRFQEIERNNDVAFGCVVLAVAERVTIVDGRLYHYRVGLKTNLQSFTWRTPDLLVSAWGYVADELARCGVLEAYSGVLATMSLGSLFYVLNTWKDVELYGIFFNALQKLIQEHPFYSAAEDRIGNTQTLEYYRECRDADSPQAFLLAQENYNLVRMSNWLNEIVSLKKRFAGLRAADAVFQKPRPSVSIVVIGSDEGKLSRTMASLDAQTLRPAEVLCSGAADPDMIRPLIDGANGEMICFISAGFAWPSNYTLERDAMRLATGDIWYRHRPANEFFGTLYLKKDLPADAASMMASWPDVVAAEEPGDSLPADLKNVLAGIAGALDALDIRNLKGRYCELLAKVATVFDDEASQRFVCRLLHEIDYVHYREFLIDYGWTHSRSRLDEVHNLAWDDVPMPRMDLSAMSPIEPCLKPRVTFVIPAMDVEPYFCRCIESVRRQSRADLEIICVDDGSSDRTGEFMDRYAAIDGRVRVVHQDNHGLGESRNIAMDMARGEYIAFVDGDDWIHPETAEVVMEKADAFALDFCSYDMRGFRYDTRARVPFFWSVSRQRANTPVDKAVSLADFKSLRLCVSACTSFYRLDFLKRNALRFSRVKYGEDMIFSFTVWAQSKRFMILDREFYNYRRGQPTSMVSRLSAGHEEKDALVAQREKYTSLLNVYNEIYKGRLTVHEQKLFRENVIIDLLYYAERSAEIRSLFREGFWRAFDMAMIGPSDIDQSIYARKLAMEKLLEHGEETSALDVKKGYPPIYAVKWKMLSEKRKTTVHDLYIVTGQLNSVANEPIDSWTFFRWLQDNGIPSRYVIWKKHAFCAKLTAEGMLKDVVVLDGDGVQDNEFYEKTKDVLPRTRAIVQENSALNYDFRRWITEDSDIAHVFLQHGVFFTTFSEAVARVLGQFTFVNVSSERERKFILDRTPAGSTLTPEKLVIGGLPRWDMVRDLSGEISDRVVFVMLTWRASFNRGMAALRKSAYYNRLRQFLSETNVQRLHEKGIRLVFAPHHFLANAIKDLDFGVPVEMASTADVSYWIRHARMLVTDFSSVSVDFLFQNKPVIYWNLDGDDLLLNVAVHDDGGKVKSAGKELRSLFNTVNTSAEVVDLTCRYADRDFVLEPENRKIAESFFTDKKNISARVYASIERAIEGRAK